MWGDKAERLGPLGVGNEGRGGKLLWERTGSFSEQGRGKYLGDSHILDRSLPLPCGFGEEESRMGAGNLLKVMTSASCRVHTRARHS